MKTLKDLKAEQMMKVHWTIPNPEEIGCAGESLWAKYLGDGLAEIHNSPFFTDAFGLYDIVRIERKDGLWEIVEVVDQGCRTIIAIWDTDSPKMPDTCACCNPEPHKEHQKNLKQTDKDKWKQIYEHFDKYEGVHTESAQLGHFSISVPVDMDDKSIMDMCNSCPVSLVISLEEIPSK
jgi:hypothetical protein